MSAGPAIKAVYTLAKLLEATAVVTEVVRKFNCLIMKCSYNQRLYLYNGCLPQMDKCRTERCWEGKSQGVVSISAGPAIKVVYTLAKSLRATAILAMVVRKAYFLITMH
jgi:hypothetical protein